MSLLQVSMGLESTRALQTRTAIRGVKQIQGPQVSELLPLRWYASTQVVSLKVNVDEICAIAPALPLAQSTGDCVVYAVQVLSHATQNQLASPLPYL